MRLGGWLVAHSPEISVLISLTAYSFLAKSNVAYFPYEMPKKSCMISSAILDQLHPGPPPHDDIAN
jgi:hypothetical protein